MLDRAARPRSSLDAPEVQSPKPDKPLRASIKRWGSQESAAVERQFRDGQTIGSIASEFGRTRKAVHAYLVRRGLVRKKRGSWTPGPGSLTSDDTGETSCDYPTMMRAAMIAADMKFCKRMESAIARGYERDPRRPA